MAPREQIHPCPPGGHRVVDWSERRVGHDRDHDIPRAAESRCGRSVRVVIPVTRTLSARILRWHPDDAVIGFGRDPHPGEGGLARSRGSANHLARPSTLPAASRRSGSPTGERRIMSHTRFAAMGTTVEVWSGDSRVRPWFETVEGICSRFRTDSELTAINETAPGTLQVSDLMLDVLRAAAKAHEITAGFVDIAVEPALTAWGYDRTFEDVGDLSNEPGPIAAGQWRVNGSSLTLAPGTRLDLGGIAKGWTCDRAVEAGMATVVSAGGDLRSSDERTLVDLADPWGTTIARVAVGVGALATSSMTRRRWKAGRLHANHIIDPRTMSPVVSPVLSATVVAESAVGAEAGAKAVLIHGADGLAWADEQDWVRSAVVVWDDGAVYATHGTEMAA